MLKGIYMTKDQREFLCAKIEKLSIVIKNVLWSEKALMHKAERPSIGRGWSGGAMVLGKLPVPGRPTIWITVGQGPTALAGGAGGGFFWTFLLSSILSLLFLPGVVGWCDGPG